MIEERQIGWQNSRPHILLHRSILFCGLSSDTIIPRQISFRFTFLCHYASCEVEVSVPFLKTPCLSRVQHEAEVSVSILHGPYLSRVWNEAEVLVPILQGQCLSLVRLKCLCPSFFVFCVLQALKLLVVSLFIESSGCFTVL